MTRHRLPRPDGLGWMNRPFRPKTQTSYHNAVLFLDRCSQGAARASGGVGRGPTGPKVGHADKTDERRREPEQEKRG